MQKKYQERASSFLAESQLLQKRYDRLGLVRLACFILLVAVILLAWRETPWWSGLLLTGGCVWGFAQLVRWHARIQASAHHLKHLATINENEAKGAEQDFSAFDTGNEFVDDSHPYSYDMDIFGPYSVFQMINRGQTSIGQQRLADWLKGVSDTSDIFKRHAALEELSMQLDWQHHFRAYGASLDEEHGQISRLKDWLEQDDIVLGKPLRTLALWVAPILFVAAMVLWMTIWPWFLAFLLFIPAVLWLRDCLDEVQELHSRTGKATETLASYAQLIEHIEEANFESPLLISLQSKFKQDTTKASTSIKRLAYRLSQLDVRYNAFVFLLEFSVVWDLQQAYRLDKWKAANRHHLAAWFDALAEMEALLSLGNLLYNNPEWTIPTIEDNRTLEAIDLGHPLISPQKRVCNSIEMPTEGHMHLLTGSNMAGKSTWLRTIGINIVLALAGAPVCAKKLVLSPMQVYTSMRTQDALHESTSSFYAELKRLKFIIEAVEDPSKTEGRPVFFLLDEILKGTNSEDRHTGSKALIRQLIASKGAGVIATHDLELGQLEAESNGQIENWAIEVDVQDGQLFFDYKLKRGVSKSFNATLLMQQMGIKI